MTAPAPDPMRQAQALLRLLDADDVDAAIDAGLAGFDAEAVAALPPSSRAR
ncbi:hypothetical protein H0E84_01990, partial [Luteimonas sp. SJ-92]|nr:hypothetical protein [Luteimonas salinisoli]